MKPTPRVSIGLPVYNGENYLEASIRSILAQTLDDLELVISDNASTDRSVEIINDYAARDPRVRLLRNEHNLGAGPNYNLTFEASRGVYFKWAAHDDRMKPTFLERSAAVLDADPEVVLCQSVIEYIDDADASIGFYDASLVGSDDPRPSRRFGALVILPHACTDFFGLLRREKLQGSLLHGPYPGHDRAFLAEMALRGRFCRLDEPLQQIREHGERYTQATHDPEARLAWHDASRAGRVSFPAWRLYREYLEMVPRNVPDRGERIRCYGWLVRWWATNWNAARMGVDLLAAVAPGALRRAEAFKQRHFRPAPRYADLESGSESGKG